MRVFLNVVVLHVVAMAELMIPLPQFPAKWGTPPESADGGSATVVELAGGYGYGTVALSKWIEGKMAADAKANDVQYPPAFGEVPTMLTRDYVPLPFGYGRGSGTIRDWLHKQYRNLYGNDDEQIKLN